MSNHSRPKCSLTGHPDYNASGDWATSKPGKLYAAAVKKRLRFGEDIKGGPNGQIKTLRTRPGGGRGKPKGNKTWVKKGNNHAHDAPLLASLCHTSDPQYLITGRLTGARNNITSNYPISHTQCKVLLDTGAVMGNYCSKQIGNWVRATHPEC
jgi:hypothetical protein